jgi:RNA polymerase sigma-70 factor (ECF subfamily)
MSEGENWSVEQLIERLKRHDERAFNVLVRQYEGRIYRLVFRLVGRADEAEDLAQEVFVQVFKAIGTFRGEAKLGTWIYRIAINLCKNRTQYLARRRAMGQGELDSRDEQDGLRGALGVTSGEFAEPDQVVEGLEAEGIVQQAILELDEEFREVLVLRDVEDLTYEEITAITGLAEGTVKSRIHRARAQLKAKVSRALGERVR